MVVVLVLALLALGVLVAVGGFAALRARAINRPGMAVPVLADHALPAVSEETLAAAARLVAADNKIAAVKRVRTDTGLDLKNAKAVVDALLSGRAVPPATGRTRTGIGAGNGSPVGGARALPADLQAEARQLIEGRQTIRAVKLIKTRTGVNLVEAKAMADELRDAGFVPGPAEAGTDLAGRVRALLGAGRRAEAVDLVARATGMAAAEADAFVTAMQPH